MKKSQKGPEASYGLLLWLAVALPLRKSKKIGPKRAEKA